VQEINEREELSEHRIQLDFLRKLIDCDREGLLYQIVWDQYSAPIRLLVDNKFLFQPFSKHQVGLISEENWQSYFARSKEAV
jgi:hypothetical protein